MVGALHSLGKGQALDQGPAAVGRAFGGQNSVRGKAEPCGGRRG